MFDNIILESTLRLVVALLLGGIIGLEREYRSKDAGFRTHFLVAVGAALFTILSQYGFDDQVKDCSRVAAQIVSGIGFLGAGLIVFQKNVVRGLTTAAGLWVTAAIGMACGVGMYWCAIIVTVLILVGLEVLNELIPQIGLTTLQVSFSSPTREGAKRIVEQIKSDSVEITSYEMRERRTSKGEIFEVNMGIRTRRGEKGSKLFDYINELDDVTMVSIE